MIDNNKYKNNLIWIDLEMTGLDPEKNRIIEIATLITDINLNIIVKGPNLVIYQKNKHLFNMNKWNLKIHTKTGLLNKVKKSFINEFIAEKLTINFLKNYIKKKSSPICGNTVAQDRRFLFKYMPKLESFFNYKYIDVSVFKELFNRWIPNFINFNKKNIHKALYDVEESVNELLYYKFFLNKYLNIL